MASRSFLHELLAVRHEASDEELIQARDALYAPFGLAYCIDKGFRARAEEDLARLLAKVRRDEAEGCWRPIEGAPDDLAEGLFAYPDGQGGYVLMVVYGYAPSGREARPVVYDLHGVRPDPDEPAALSAKEIALANGATQWRPIPPHPACPR